MSGAPSGWGTPYTTWSSNDGVANTDLNRIEDNIEAIETGDRVLTPSEPAGSNTEDLRTLLDNFAYKIKELNLYGASNWYSTGGEPLISSSRVDGLGPISAGSFNIAAYFKVDIPANYTLYIRRVNFSLNTDLRLQLYNSSFDNEYISASNSGQDQPYEWLSYNSTGSTITETIFIRIYNDGAGPVSTQGTDNYTCIFTLEPGLVTTTTTGAP